MIHTEHHLTLSLAIAFGTYMLAAGIGGLMNRQRWIGILDELRASTALSFITGLMTFVLGIVIILSHNYWGDPLAIFISLIGWIAALKGLLFVVDPRPAFSLADEMLKPPILNTYLFIVIGVGGLLVLAGLTGTTS